MPEYRSLSKDECADIILSIDEPLIVMHQRPDGDTVGTAKALGEVFSALGKRVHYACAEDIPHRLKFVFGDATLSEYSEGMTPVAVDVASPMQLGSLKVKIPSFKLMIDHHAIGSPFADNYIIPDESSASEVLFDIVDTLVERGVIELTQKIAYPLYTALSSDTGCFCYSCVTPKTHLMASRLIATGIDFSDINVKLFSSKSLEQLNAESYIAGNIKTALDGKVAYSYIPKSVRDSLGVKSEHLETCIDVVRSLEGADVAFVVKETDDGIFRASLRSTGPDVATVAKGFSGGGHIRAAGCNVDAKTIEEACDKLLASIIKNLIREV